MEDAANSIIQQTVTESSMINFEIIRCGPYRFIGKSVYVRNWGPNTDIVGFLWEQSDPILKTLDGMKEYASDDLHDAGLSIGTSMTAGGNISNAFFAETQLGGFMIGRFMKAGAPVSEGMDYIDIPEMYFGKGWIRGKPGINPARPVGIL